MTPTPPNIAAGTVAARIRAYQDCNSPVKPTTTISNSSSKSIRQHGAIAPKVIVSSLQRVERNCAADVSQPLYESARFDGDSMHDPPSAATVEADLSPANDHITGSRSLPRSSRIQSQYVSCIANDHVDGSSDLPAMRARLRSITDGMKSRSDSSESGGDVLGELGSMLADALGKSMLEQREKGDESPYTAFPYTEPGSPRSGIVRPLHSGNAQRFVAKMTGDDRNSTIIVTDTQTQPLNPERIQKLDTGHVSIRQKDHRSSKSADANHAKLKSSELSAPFHAPRRSLDNRPERQNGYHPRTASLYGAQRPSVFSRYRSNHVKQRAAVFDAREKEDTRAAGICDAPHAGEVHHKDSWLQQETQPTSKPLGIEHYVVDSQSPVMRAMSGSQDDVHLIPLALPQLVEAWETHEKTVSNNVSGELEVSGHVPQSQHSFQTVKRLPSSKTGVHDDLEKRHAMISRPQSHQSMRSLPTGNAHSRMTKGELLTAKRPSIVRNKIDELMAMSAREDQPQPQSSSASANGGGRLQQHNNNNTPIKKVEASNQIVQNAPTLQSSPMQQGEATLIDPKKTLSTTTTHFREDGTSTVGKTDSHPVSPAKDGPSTPSRGRSRTVKESIATNGSPYAIEQRFSLSPARSHSRISTNGVKVSIEVRGPRCSPERCVGETEERLLIVRASVDPEDLQKDL